MTEDQNKMLVQQHLYEGRSLAELADHWGMSYQGMAQKLRSPRIKELIDAVMAKVENESTRAATFVRLNLLDYVRRMHTIALDDQHPQQYPALKYQIDKIWPTVQVTEDNRNYTIESETLEKGIELMNRYAAIAERRTNDVLNSPHLLRGEAALPSPRTLDADADAAS